MHSSYIKIIVLSLFIAGLAIAGDMTITLSGDNPLTVNIKGTSVNQEAGSFSVYLYYCDDTTSILDAGNVTADILETTWGWGTWLLTKRIEEGSWTKGGHTFTKRFFYDNAGVSSLDDYWTTEGINALVCSFTTVGSGHAYIEVNGSDGLADWTAHAHTITYINQDQSLAGESSLSVTLDALPEETGMENAYPNPFNPTTYIAYHLAEDSDVRISVYDMLGRKVQTLFNGPQRTGRYQIYWNGKNAQGGSAPTGTYLIRMQTDKMARVQKVLLIK